MTITFIDSGVLVTAARGVGEDPDKALEILKEMTGVTRYSPMELSGFEPLTSAMPLQRSTN